MTLGIRTSTFKFRDTNIQSITLMIKTLTQLREGNFFNLIDYLQKKPIANITLNGEILDAFPQEQEQEQGKDVDSYHSFHQSTGRPRGKKKKQKTG